MGTVEFDLSKKTGWVDSWQIRDYQQTHPSHSTEILEVKDVKEFIRRLKEEFGVAKNWGAKYTDLIDKLAGKILTEQEEH